MGGRHAKAKRSWLSILTIGIAFVGASDVPAAASSCSVDPNAPPPPPPVVVEGTFLGTVEDRTGEEYAERQGLAVPTGGLELYRFEVESTSSPRLDVGGTVDARLFFTQRFVDGEGRELMSTSPGALPRPPVDGHRYRLVARWGGPPLDDILVAGTGCGDAGRLVALDDVPRQPPSTLERGQEARSARYVAVVGPVDPSARLSGDGGSTSWLGAIIAGLFLALVAAAALRVSRLRRGQSVHGCR